VKELHQQQGLFLIYKPKPHNFLCIAKHDSLNVSMPWLCQCNEKNIEEGQPM